MRRSAQEEDLAREEKRAAAAGCTLKDRTCYVGTITPDGCRACGWNRDEAKRRNKLPLFRDERGKWHKCVGVRTPVSWSVGNGGV